MLLRMLAEDEFGLLELPVKAPPVTPEDRVIAAYEEIAHFVRTHGRNPQRNAADIGESKLAMRLKAFSEDEEKRTLLADVDELGLLAEPEPPASLEEVFDDDPLGLLGNAEEIFTLRHVPKSQTMPAEVARRRPAPDFEQFRRLFVDCQADLRAGRRKLLPFKNPSEIRPGRFFVQGGVLLYVVEVGERRYDKIQKANARTRCIFENGTESGLLLQSLASNLYKGGKRVTDLDDDALDAVEERLTLAAETEMASVYVLRSLSEDPQVTALPGVYKIGSTSRTARQRVTGAETTTTFLGASVEVVEEYLVPRGAEGRIERLLHRLFAPARLDIWFERDGRAVADANEWFVVPFAVIDQAVGLLENNQIVNYEYDPANAKLALKA